MSSDDERTPEKSEKSTPHTIRYEDPSDPLYLHHSDQRGLILVKEVLSFSNYPLWSHAILMALISKNKDGFIDDTIVKPSSGSAASIRQWIRCDILVKGWILNTISPSIAQSVMYSDSAHALWNELQERLSQRNNVDLFHIEQEIHNCVQEGMTIGECYSKLKGLWDTRDVLFPIPPCDGNTAKALQGYQQTQRTIKFLMGLNEVYTAARRQILLMQPLPSVNKVFSLVNQDEKQRGVSSQVIGKASKTAAFAVQERQQYFSKNQPPGNTHIKCNRCNMTGHTTDHCRTHLKCDFCGFKGHTIDVFRKLKRADGFKGENLNFTSKVHSIDSNKTPTSYSLTAEQYNDYLTLIDRKKAASMANQANQVDTGLTMNNISGPTFRDDDWDGN